MQSVIATSTKTVRNLTMLVGSLVLLIAFLPSTAVAGSFEGCFTSAFQEPGLTMSLERFYSEPGTQPADSRLEEAGDYDAGMSCDGPASCSPTLVAVIVSAPADKHSPSGPTCDGSPASDCDFSPGETPESRNLELTRTHVRGEGETALPEREWRELAESELPAQMSESIRNLNPRHHHDRLDRPPRA